MATVKHAPNLITFEQRGGANPYTPTLLALLGRCRHLQRLSLDGPCWPEQDCLRHLSSLRQLTGLRELSLALRGTEHFGAQGLSSLTRLTRLEVTGIVDFNTAPVVTRLTQLRHLVLAGIVADFLSVPSMLTHLDLSAPPMGKLSLSYSSLVACTRLVHLSIQGLGRFDPLHRQQAQEDLEPAAGHALPPADYEQSVRCAARCDLRAPRLQSLTVSASSMNAVPAMVLHATALRVLSLNAISAAAPLRLPAAIRALKRLKVLDVSRLGQACTLDSYEGTWIELPHVITQLSGLKKLIVGKYVLGAEMPRLPPRAGSQLRLAADTTPPPWRTAFQPQWAATDQHGIATFAGWTFYSYPNDYLDANASALLEFQSLLRYLAPRLAFRLEGTWRALIAEHCDGDGDQEQQ